MNAQSDSIKSKAYLIFSEFGPDLRVPRQKRLADEFKSMSEERIQTWLADFQDLDKKIWKLAEEGGRKNFHREEFRESLTLEYPWLNEAGLQRAWSRCAYYIVHEGYGSYRV